MENSTKAILREINRLVRAGYDEFDPESWQGEQAAACDEWLVAWELVKQLATPQHRSLEQFDAAYSLKMPVSNWLADLEMYLHNAGLEEASYFEKRIRFVREQLAYFPDIDDDSRVRLRRAEGEALWRLGRQTEAEAVYQALVDQLPDQAWAYIGWADQYHLGTGRPSDYPRAEAILLSALEQPNLDDRRSVIERLVDFYEAWGKPEKIPPLTEEYEALLAAERERILAEKARLLEEVKILKKFNQATAGLKRDLGRNDPCWCGSGKKYKQCHWQSDRRDG